MKYNSTSLGFMSNNNPGATDSFSTGDSSALIPKEAAQVEIVEQLTYDEEYDRSQLELRVEQAFYQAGKALAELRQRRLYRSTHRTFEAYCQDTFEFSRRHSDNLIAGAGVVENLQQTRINRSQTESNEKMSTNRTQILPTKLEQIRPLASLKPDEQRQVWDQAVAAANGRVPSGRIVKGVVEQQKKSLLPATDDYQEGDVFTLVRLEGRNKKYRGCWAVVRELTDSTVMVDVHDATLTVELHNLDRIDSQGVKRQVPEILQRIRQLRQVGFLDRGAYNVLEALGKQTNLTSVEEGLLSWLEQYYRVNEQKSEL